MVLIVLLCTIMRKTTDPGIMGYFREPRFAGEADILEDMVIKLVQPWT
jgi:hypothetical protein